MGQNQMELINTASPVSARSGLLTAMHLKPLFVIPPLAPATYRHPMLIILPPVSLPLQYGHEYTEFPMPKSGIHLIFSQAFCCYFSFDHVMEDA